MLDAAAEAVGASELAVIGMGKLGGRELNYASDVDVLFVGGDPKAARGRDATSRARRCFRVDANLRPEGRDGALTRSVESYDAYWERWAQPWEFQALLKARPVAGDATLGKAFADAAAAALWDRPLDRRRPSPLRDLKQRAEGEIARRGLADREVKRGPGGIRDVEFAVQLLQLVHGSADPEIRSPTTLVALEQLAAGGYVDADDADRARPRLPLPAPVEHALQLDDEQQVHTVPAGPRRAAPSGPRAGVPRDARGGRDRPVRRGARRHQRGGAGHPRAAVVPAAARRARRGRRRAP